MTPFILTFFQLLKKLNRKRNRFFHELKRRIRLICLAKNLPAAKKHQTFPANTQKILFPFVKLGLGDAVCHTGLWQRLQAMGHRVQIITEKRGEAFFKNLDCIDEVFVVDTDNISLPEKISSDVVICMYSWMQQKEVLEIKLLSKIKYSFAISIGGWLKKPYNIVLDLPDKFHITDPQKRLLETLGYTSSGLAYQLNTLIPSDNFIDDYLRQRGGKKNVILNPFASVAERSMTFEQIHEIIQKLQPDADTPLFIIGEKHKLARLEILNGNVYICDFDSLWHTISLINKADLVISVETAVVHIACALNKKLVSTFYSTNINYNDALQSNTIFKPVGENTSQIIVNRSTLPFDADRVVQESLAMLSNGDNCQKLWH